MKLKTRVTWVFAALLSTGIATGAVLKLAAFPPMVAIYSKTGMEQYLKVLGSAELIFLTLFLFPRTMRIGFFLLTAYFGGAMAVELSHGGYFMMPAIILAFVWIIAYLRDASLFQQTLTQKNTFTSLQTME